MTPAQPIDFDTWVPIFPLPNAVLLPGAILPLHVFEARYRKLTEDALLGSRLIAIALLKPGFESRYHRLDVDIHSAVGIGRIIKDERLPDGRFNLVLQGLTRARIRSENRQRAYRRGKLEPICCPAQPPEAECEIRGMLRRILCDGPLAPAAEQYHWTDLLKCAELSLSCLLDVLGHLVLPDAASKQAYLETPSVRQRGEILCRTFCTIAARLAAPAWDLSHAHRSWPPRVYEN